MNFGVVFPVTQRSMQAFTPPPPPSSQHIWEVFQLAAAAWVMPPLGVISGVGRGASPRLLAAHGAGARAIGVAWRSLPPSPPTTQPSLVIQLLFYFCLVSPLAPN